MESVKKLVSETLPAARFPLVARVLRLDLETQNKLPNAFLLLYLLTKPAFEGLSQLTTATLQAAFLE